jgi:ribosome-binding protein aMBF1 (putative translation factor)
MIHTPKTVVACPTPTLSEQVRQAMIASGINDLELSRHVDVAQTNLRSFRRGESDARASTLDKLAAFLGLTLAKPRRRGRK